MNEKPMIEVNTDPAQQAAVMEFLQNRQASNEPKATPQPAKLEADQVFNEQPPEALMMSEALAKLHHVPVTDEERDLYLKAMLTDHPVRFDIALFGGKLIFRIRSRTMLEQERVLLTVKDDAKKGLIPQDDPALAYTRVQQYCAALQVERINGEIFSELALQPGKSFEEDVAILHTGFHKHFVGMTHLRWVALLNALIMFEAKCKTIAEECLNENFLKPQGPSSSA